MKKISKADAAKLEEIVADLNSKKTEIETAVEEANSKIGAANEAIASYNESVAEAEALRDEVVAAIEEYTSERSEKWQEGDAAASYQEWSGEWENVDFSELDPIEEIEAPDASIGEELEALPQEVSL